MNRRFPDPPRRLWVAHNAAKCDRQHGLQGSGYHWSLSLRYQGFRGRICEIE